MSAPIPSGTMSEADYAKWLLSLRNGDRVAIVNREQRNLEEIDVLSISMAYVTVWAQKYDRKTGRGLGQDLWIWPVEWARARDAARVAAEERERQEERLRTSIRARLNRLPLEALERIERIAAAEGRL